MLVRCLPAILLVACSSTIDAPSSLPSDPVQTPALPTEPPPSAPPPSATPPAATPPAFGTCLDPIPAGAAKPPALPTYAAACPALVDAPATTAIVSSGAERRFVVVKPSSIAPGEKLPLVFAWHWLKGSAEDMMSALELQTAADARRMVFVAPVAKGDLYWQWPMMSADASSRFDEETKFFDDMLACVAAALPIQEHCVSSVGVSAGALFTAQLASARADRLASFVSISGGVGDPAKSFAPAARKIPGLVLWGGPTDKFPNETLTIIDFEDASNALANALVSGGHPIVECVHNCGHDVPPFDAPPAGMPKADLVFRFVLDHPYWSAAGKSPYAGGALPPSYPSWCGVGHGAVAPRPASAACP